MNPRLPALAIIFGQLSLLAFGGGFTILPEIQRQVVDVHAWMSAEEFSAIFALSQASPGPNLIIVVLIGWTVAGWAGALISALCIFIPSAILTMMVVNRWQSAKEHRWRKLIKQALGPVSIGLIASSAFIIATTSATDPMLVLVFVASAAIVFATEINPLWVLLTGAAIGYFADTINDMLGLSVFG